MEFGEFAGLAVGDVAGIALARVGTGRKDIRDLGAAPLGARARSERTGPEREEREEGGQRSGAGAVARRPCCLRSHSTPPSRSPRREGLKARV